MADLNSSWLTTLGNFAKQYAGVPKFGAAVVTIRDLHIETPLRAIDEFSQWVEEYRQLCQELHKLADTPLDPRYQHVQQQIMAKGSEIAGIFTNFTDAIASGIKKLALAFVAIQNSEKYLTENRRAAADMVNMIKALDGKLTQQRTIMGTRPINILLDEIRRDAGDVVPIVR
jgi:hypothetical protein